MIKTDAKLSLILILFCLVLESVSRKLFYVPNVDVFLVLYLAFVTLNFALRHALLTGLISAVYLSQVHQWQPITENALTKAVFWVVLLGFAAGVVWFYKQKLTNSAKQAALKASEADLLLNEQRRQFEAILDHSPAVIYMKDPDGKLIFVNKEYQKLLNLPRESIVGKNERDVWPPEATAKWRLVDERVLSTKQPVREEEKAPTEDGLRHYLSVRFPVLNELGKVTAVAGISTDITEQKNAESEKSALEIRERSALESARLKSEFLATMSHEIRTPINGIMGMASLLADTEITTEQKSYLDAVQRSADSLLTVINDILDFSKIEAGKLEFELINFDLVEMIDDAVRTFEFSARAKNLILTQKLSPEVPQAAVGDPGRLRQILNNLLSNAMKFTETGSITLRAQVVAARVDGPRLRIEVQDTGIGLSTDAVAKMFKPFSQADASTSRRFGGTGLGLSISRHLVEKMGGEIGVLSEDGRGSTFWFEVNLGHAVVTRAGTVQPQAPSAALRVAKKDVRILVAEDNQINRAIALKTLEKLGYKADAVADGNEVLDAIREIDYDLILMDCQMPNMDGYQATRAIRSSGSLTRYQTIPILALTANAMKGDAEKCLSEGMNDYLSKPITRKDLEAALSKWLVPRAG